MTNVQGLTIRPAAESDVDMIFNALAGIAETVGERHKLTSSPEDLRRYGFGDRPAFGCLIAEIEQRFAGCCLYFPSFSTWMGKPGAYVQDFYVAEEFRGQGVGEGLLQRLASMTRAQGGSYIRLAVDKKNHRAQAFYRRCGILHSDTEQIHMARDEDFDRLADADPLG
ncbi:MAG: GNAT family N-acetyltransferase [Rhizobiaceae bacterium]|nr:GNAT family N-acetyltransferase [Rhizobiaceae bacterium]